MHESTVTQITLLVQTVKSSRFAGSADRPPFLERCHGYGQRRRGIPGPSCGVVRAGRVVRPARPLPPGLQVHRTLRQGATARSNSLSRDASTTTVGTPACTPARRRQLSGFCRPYQVVWGQKKSSSPQTVDINRSCREMSIRACPSELEASVRSFGSYPYRMMVRYFRIARRTCRSPCVLLLMLAPIS
jgi:hypothetical protein